MKNEGLTPTPTFLAGNKSKLMSGFTLIEIIIYMTLFSIMMGGLIVTVFQLIQNTEKMTLKNFDQEEINFVLKKIDWAFSDAISINHPLSGTSDELEVNKYNYIDNPVTLRLNTFDPQHKHIELCLNNIDCNPITTRNVEVNDFSVIYLDNIDPIPDGIETIINIDGIEISNIKYLRL